MEAVRLFVARGQAVRADFALTPDNVTAVVGICHHLDGLPLAIELAAARIKVLPPSALLTRLARRLPLLSDGGRDLPARQQTMRDTIAWSYDLLPSNEQAVFRRLAVFVGGFSLEAAEALVNPDSAADVLGRVTSLVENSLVRQVGRDREPRFRMLETVREFGMECLVASGEEAPTRSAHAAWFLTLAEADESWTWGGTTQKQWLDRLEVELPNLRAALAWFDQAGDADAVARLAASLEGYWHVRSLRDEGRAWLDRALTQGIASDRTRAKALLALGGLDHLTGSQRVTDLFTQGLILSRRLEDPRGAANALFKLGIYARNQGEHARAMSFLTEACSFADESGDLQTAAITRLQLAVAALGQSGAEYAEPLLAEALVLLHQQNDTYGIACAQLVLGWVATERRDGATAAANYAESLALWQELGTQEGVVDVLAGVADLAATARQPERAARLLAAAEALGESVGYVLPVPERARYDRTQVELRATLGAVAFAREWSDGLKIPVDVAVAEAKVVLAELRVGMSADAPRTPPADGGLTPREREVLRLVVAGHSNPQIADALFLSRRTVTTHLTRIFAKLGVKGRAEAAVHAVRHDLV
jgi:non-specific serine/threonine protein kinase